MVQAVKIFQYRRQFWRADLTEVVEGGGLRNHVVTFRCLGDTGMVSGRTSMSPERMSQPELAAALSRLLDQSA
jgi:hypothetical protein